VAGTTRRPEDQARLDRFGNALAAALKAGGRIRTQEKLADVLGVKQTTVSTWVTAKKAPRSRSTVEDIERALGPGVCPPGSLQQLLYGGIDPDPVALPTPREIVERIRRLLDELDRHLDDDDAPRQQASARGGRRGARLRSVEPGSPGTDTRGRKRRA
jgi:DNA-binding transcriptional regulator YdaS (Cro superfamily)